MIGLAAEIETKLAEGTRTGSKARETFIDEVLSRQTRRTADAVGEQLYI